MRNDYWHKQGSEPLFPDLLWSRPENRAQAGKLLIAGGNLHGFSAPATAYSEAQKAGIGVARTMLPDIIRKQFPHFQGGTLEMEYVPSTPSGSFAGNALAELLATSHWADSVLLAGDFGRNSETAILLEKFTGKYDGQLTITQDAADYFIPNPTSVLARSNTLLVISFAQLQKLAMNAKFRRPFTFDMDFLPLIDTLHEFTTAHKVFIITKHLDTLFVAVNGQVSTTKLDPDPEIWRVRTAAHASVWWLQNPTKAFEALTTALIPKNI